ncbi:hypothetical protein IGB42_03397 [Andreprevotia sp. IGB-42]|uniref:hypothetical protein n=1 Tax=Andreprevotia sp. IGB-42 TaxID=2497473 RepID=UPI00135ADB3E|nr:hypothetical protein [Andreprevotia sp. IGB-42]KAF0812120.1 hypothetical protein IGB42_03397 [Andreprevotia sp. IGB-42]
MSQTATLFALLFAAFWSPWAVADCQLQEATPAVLAELAGGVTLEGSDDNAEAPLWLGPVRTPACTLEPELFRGPLATAQGRYLFLIRTSGSEQQLAQYDLQQCKLIWQSKPQFGAARLLKDGYQIGKKRLRFDPQCRPRKTS